MTYYVNWEKREILTEEEFVKQLDERALSLSKDARDFEDWLNATHSAYDIWSFSEDTDKDIMEEWRDVCADEALWELQNEYDEIVK